MEKKIIITGGIGYIGTELCKIYSGVSRNNKILVIDNDPEKRKKAIEAGANIINDISGLNFDPEMVNIVKDHRVPIIIMHIK